MVNRYVDLLLGEFKHYTTRLANGGIRKEVRVRILFSLLYIFSNVLFFSIINLSDQLLLETISATQVQDTLIGYGLENLSETVVEGLSRVKRCTNEGRALMSLDFQVPLIYNCIDYA